MTMKDYRIGVFFEEGAVLNISAESPEQAKEKALEMLDSYAGVDYSDSYNSEVVYRDYTVTDVEVKKHDTGRL